MRKFFAAAIAVLCLLSCDDNRIYDTIHDFDDRHWRFSDKPQFEFEVRDSSRTYTLFCNLRNSASYPFARVFLKYALKDTAENILDSALIEQFLFDPKTGRPFGESGIGDLYDHQFPLLENYTFPYSGKFRVQYQQYMRMDSLDGILAVGLRVERDKHPE